MQVLLGACEPCRVRKRKCDRAIPTCGLCSRRSIPCSYSPYRHPNKPPGSEARPLARTQDSELWGLTTDGLYYAWAVSSPEVPKSYPIAPRWYMPRLIRHFSEGLGVSRIPVDVNSTAYKLQTTWVQNALSDPCLFHATLFAGASYFDILRGEPQSALTLFHQNEVIRLVNERLSDPHWALDDRTILSITPLALFANLNGNRAASEIHRAGLWKMVELRGGLSQLGMDGLVATLVQMNKIIHTIVFDAEPGSSTAEFSITPPVGLEGQILQAVDAKSARTKASMLRIKPLFQDIYNFKLQLRSQEDCQAPVAWEYDGWGLATGPYLPPTADDPIYSCCYLATVIFWALIGRGAGGTTSHADIQSLVLNLKASLALTDNEVWLRSFPMTYTWVCLLGAAIANDPGSRIWFYFKQSSAVRTLHTRDDSPFLTDLWAHYSWLRHLRITTG